MPQWVRVYEDGTVTYRFYVPCGPGQAIAVRVQFPSDLPRAEIARRLRALRAEHAGWSSSAESMASTTVSPSVPVVDTTEPAPSAPPSHPEPALPAHVAVPATSAADHAPVMAAEQLILF